MKKFTEELTNKEPNRELQSDEYFHDSDHLIYCAKCHTPRQGRYTLQGRVFMPPIRCKCQQELYYNNQINENYIPIHSNHFPFLSFHFLYILYIIGNIMHISTNHSGK